MRRSVESPDQLPLFFSSAPPTVLPRGDGSYVVTPGKPLLKLTIRQAAARIARSVWTVYRLYHCGLLRGERPSPNGILIYADSLEELIARSRENPDLWAGDDGKPRRASAQPQ